MLPGGGASRAQVSGTVSGACWRGGGAYYKRVERGEAARPYRVIGDVGEAAGAEGQRGSSCSAHGVCGQHTGHAQVARPFGEVGGVWPPKARYDRQGQRRCTTRRRRRPCGGGNGGARAAAPMRRRWPAQRGAWHGRASAGQGDNARLRGRWRLLAVRGDWRRMWARSGAALASGALALCAGSMQTGGGTTLGRQRRHAGYPDNPYLHSFPFFGKKISVFDSR